MANGAKVRKSVPLTREDQAHLDRVRAIGTPEHEALTALVGQELTSDASEAEVLHALIVAGWGAVAERATEAGYAALAAAQDDEDRAAHRAMRARAARLDD